MANGLSKDLVEHYHKRKVAQKVKYIKEIVALYYGMSPKAFDTKSRKRELVHIRHVALYLVRENLPKEEIGLASIGSLFGGLDHATVLHAHKKISDYLSYQRDLQQEINELTDMITTRFLIDDDSSLTEGYYFVDLNNVISLKLNNEKAVVLVGFSKDEAELFAKSQKIRAKPRTHKNLGMYILEDKNVKKD